MLAAAKSLLPALALLAEATPHPAAAPTLCVDPALSSRVPLQSLVDAIRARLEPGPAQVDVCDLGEAAGWEVTVDAADESALEVSIFGIGVAVNRRIVTGGLLTEEIVRLVAQEAVEAVRPSLDLILASPPVLPVRHQDHDACHCTNVIQVLSAQEPRRPWMVVGLAAGRLGQPRGDFTLASRFSLVPSGLGLRPALNLGVAPLPSGTLHGWDVELGVGAVHGWKWLHATADLRARFSVVEGDTYVTSGVGLVTSASLLAAGRLSFGVALGVTYWPRPDRFYSATTSAFARSHLELILGPTLAWGIEEALFNPHEPEPIQRNP